LTAGGNQFAKVQAGQRRILLAKGRLADRSNFPSKQGYGGECRRLLDFISAHGRIGLGNPFLERRYCGKFRYFA